MNAVFGTGNHLLWWQECARAVVLFAYGLALVRISGRRVFGKWSALDIIVSIMVGSNLSRALTGNAQMGGTLAATTLLMVLHWVLAQAASRWPAASHALEGQPRAVVRDGEAQGEALQQDAISEADLREALHQSGVRDVSQARLVVLEPSGRLTVVKKK